MRNACLAAALVLVTMFLGGCATVRHEGTCTNGDFIIWTTRGDPIAAVGQALLIAIDLQTQPEQLGPFCDPLDPSPPAPCPPSNDVKPR